LVTPTRRRRGAEDLVTVRVTLAPQRGTRIAPLSTAAIFFLAAARGEKIELDPGYELPAAVSSA
jgi:hypothetical protein